MRLAIAVITVLVATQGVLGAPTLLVSSHNTGEIKEYDATSGELLRSFGGQASLEGPLGMAVSPHTGNLLVVSEIDATVQEFDLTSGAHIGTFASGGGLFRPCGIIFAENGNPLVSSRARRIVEFHGQTGAFLGEFATATELNIPGHMTLHPQTGNLLVVGIASDNVVEFDGTTGSFVGVFASGVLGASDLAFGPNGNLFVSSLYSDQIHEFDGMTGDFVDIFATGAELDNPQCLTFLPDGNLLVGSNGNKWVAEYDGTTGAFVGVFASGNGLDYPADLLLVPEPSTILLLMLALGFAHPGRN